MDDFNFNVENDVLYCNEVSGTDVPNVFTVTKKPIITKEIFKELYRAWIENDDEEEVVEDAAK